MESKSVIFGIIALILGGGAAAAVHSFQLEGLKSDLRRKQADVQALEQTISRSKDTIDRNEKRIEEHHANASAHLAHQQAADEMERAVTRQGKAFEAAKEKWAVNVQMMQEALEAVRLAFRNQVVPLIPMKNGEALKDCRFSACKEGMAVFQHSAGTARLSSAQLPPDLADRLRPNFPPTLVLPQDPDAPRTAPTGTLNLLAGGPAADPPAAPHDSPTPPPPPNLPTPQAEAFTAKHQAMANLKGQISAAELQISGYQQLANQATTEAEKRKVDSALRSLQSQIMEAQSQINKLQQELERLRPN